MNINTNLIKDPNLFGELLRYYFFTKDEGYGCYENFKVESFMTEGVFPKEPINKYFGEHWENKIYFYADQTNLNIWLAYSWDGDGTLIVSDGNRVAINDDCKKSYNWEWAE